MNKKLIAVAVAGVLSAPMLALADNANVTIYGRINSDFENVRANGATTGVNIPGRNRVATNGSNIGFKGTESLGNGLSVFWQLENAVGTDDGTGPALSRNTGIGLSSSWGSVLLGRWDSPMKLASIVIDPFGGTMITSYNNIFGQIGYGTGLDFDRRTTNGVQYWSPNWSGFSFRAAISANEAKSDSSVATKLNPYDASIAGSYSSGPLYVAVAYEIHKDGHGGNVLTTSAKSDNKGYRAGATYKIGNFSFGGLLERLEYESDAFGATIATKVKRNAVGLTLSYQMGNNLIRSFIARASDLKGDTNAGNALGLPATAAGASLNDTGATYFAVGYVHAMSKRTELYTSVVRINNKQAARYNFATNALPAFGAGADPQGLMLGIRHTF